MLVSRQSPAHSCPMVDFKKRLGAKSVTRPVDPMEIYKSLDRASDKGPLRPAQASVLLEWHQKRRATRDVVLKLHTGQGKTLIGLLILQSKINEATGPSVYLCPDNYLIHQTAVQAEQFGFRVALSEAGELPDDFLEGRSLFITSVQKLFNGLTKFGLGQKSLKVANVLMDDSHACIEAIRDAFTIRLEKTDPAYQQILQLFSEGLEAQGAGTFADIKNGSPDAFLPVPYWDWVSRRSDTTGILAKGTSRNSIKFVWPLLKDSIDHCQCVISGDGLEIHPYLPALDLFGSYFQAKHRVFMSATVTNDSFLVRGLRLAPETIRNPLVFKDERWSGEKMVLIPSLLHSDLNRESLIDQFGKPSAKKFGIVALVSSFRSAEKWKNAGAKVPTKDTIEKDIARLREGHYEETLTIVNRYDGIDLPDAMCRNLIFDGQPRSESLTDRYAEWCRASSEIIAIRNTRMIEQGLGRSVRGEKDYSVVILMGSRLIKAVRNIETRRLLSNQTRQQVELGLEIAAMAKEEIEKGAKPMDALMSLVKQCLKRDEGWKLFYTENMDSVVPNDPPGEILDIFQLELQAEEAFQTGDPSRAVRILQNLIDKHIKEEADRRWYMQEMARYTWAYDQSESNKLQLEAHYKNRFLLKPRTGMRIDRLVVVSQARVAKLMAWIKLSENFDQLMVSVEDILSRLQFGVEADRFEAAFDQLGKALGFPCERPDKEWKEGPDNLWGVNDSDYLIVECKSEVLVGRNAINKSESGQMNNACAWFANNYEGSKSVNIIIIPTNVLGAGAGFNEEVSVMSDAELKKLRRNVRTFFAEFATKDLTSLSESYVQERVDAHHLSVHSILHDYKRAPRS
jgi:replicative superfamily II helicase